MKKFFFYFLVATALSYAACNNNSTSANNGDSTMNAAAGTNNNMESQEKKNEQIVLSFFDAIRKKDLNAAYQYCAPNFTDYGDHTTAKPMPLDSSKSMINAFMTAFPDFTIQNPKAVSDGDTVMVWADDIGTWKGNLMGQKPTGKSFKIQDVDIFILNNDGKITEHHNIQPFSTIAQQVGMKM